MSTDEFFMSRAIEVARLADAAVFPNPYVGAVIVHQSKIIAEGYHQKFGNPHAEVHAVNQVKNPDILKECSIYVTLEPCAHHGKTPPCADLLVKHQFKRVVVGSVDPFAKVNGAGIERMKNAGIEVTVGVLKSQCDTLNKRFFTFHQKKRPYITLKWAESVDGYLAPKNQIQGERTKITGALSHLLVHQQRSNEHAILVGRKTVENDNPELNVRHLVAPSPIRFVIDPKLKLTEDYKIFQGGLPTHVLNLVEDSQKNNITFHKLTELSPASICEKLFELGILSVYIEGGAHTIQQFIHAGLWDQIYRFIGPTKLLSGIEAPKFEGVLIDKKSIEQDELQWIEPA